MGVNKVEAPVRMAARPGDAGPSRWGAAARNGTFNLISLAAVVLLWIVVAGVVETKFIPRPLGVLKAFKDLLLNGDLEGYSLARHMWVSFVRVSSGFGLALVTGVPLGLAMGLYRPLYNGTRAVIEPIRFIPPIAWIPMAIVLMSGYSRYVFLIWLGAFFPIFINTLVAVPRVEPIWINVVRVYGANRLFTITRVVIPAVLPDIVGGMRVSIGSSWMTIVAAEMIGGESVGLGRLILKYADLLRMEEIVVGMGLIGLLGFLSNEALIALERRAFRWRTEVSID